VRNARGIALSYIVFLLLLFLPLVIVLGQAGRRQLGLHTLERQSKSARVLANNIATDVMRQLSEDYFVDHFDPLVIDRFRRYTFDMGSDRLVFNDVKMNPAERTIFLKAEGVYTGPAQAVALTKKLTAVVKFVSDLGRFGMMIDGNAGGAAIDTDDLVVEGGLWVDGDLDVAGKDVVFRNGPVIVTGQYKGRPDTVFDNASLYCHQPTNPAPTLINTSQIVTGFLPPVEWMSLSELSDGLNYHRKRHNLKFTGEDQEWEFFVQGGIGRLRNSAGVVLAELPAYPKGLVLVVEDANVTLRGQVKGRVTVVAAADPADPARGQVTIGDDLVYDASSVGNSLAVLASHQIRIEDRGAGGPEMIVQGLFYVDAPGATSISVLAPEALPPAYNRSLRLQGSLLSPFTHDGEAFPGGITITHDPALLKHRPPQVPEKPVLVTWRLQG